MLMASRDKTEQPKQDEQKAEDDRKFSHKEHNGGLRHSERRPLLLQDS
jgi:hypothetical protein